MFQHGGSKYHLLSEWFRMQIALKKVNLICFWETTTKSTFRKRLMPPASQEWRGEKALLLWGSGLCWEDVSWVVLSQLRTAPIGTNPLKGEALAASGREAFLKSSQETSRPQVYSHTSGLPVNYKATSGWNLSLQTPACGLLLFPYKMSLAQQRCAHGSGWRGLVWAMECGHTATTKQAGSATDPTKLWPRDNTQCMSAL